MKWLKNIDWVIVMNVLIVILLVGTFVMNAIILIVYGNKPLDEVPAWVIPFIT